MAEDVETKTGRIDDQNRLTKRLIDAVIPHPLADRVAKEYSISQLDAAFQECVEEDAKACLLTPLVANADMKAIAKGSDSAWSEAVLRAFYSVHTEMSGVLSSFHELQELVEDHGELLSALHQKTERDDALDLVLSANKRETIQRERHVHIEICETDIKLLPTPTEQSFYSLELLPSHPLDASITTLVFRTTSGDLCSSKVIVQIMSGPAYVNEVKTAMKPGFDHVGLARDAAASIMKVAKLVGNKKDRRVLIIRGLPPAVEAEAKKAGYRAEFKSFLDMVSADLMLEHDVVVLQAFRQNDDVELLLKQMALACFHYQLLTERISDRLG